MDTPPVTHIIKPLDDWWTYADQALYWAMVNDGIIKRDEVLEAQFAAGKVELGT